MYACSSTSTSGSMHIRVNNCLTGEGDGLNLSQVSHGIGNVCLIGVLAVCSAVHVYIVELENIHFGTLRFAAHW